ncbi:hypothetical protein VCHENC02_5104B, partial [Vibrio harveyi]
CRELLNILD